MPTYDYKCNACSHTFEQFQSMKDKPLRKCPKCGKSALERLIGTGAAVIFKGSGFYQTDYRSEAYKKSAEADKKPEAKPATSETKSDGKAGDAKPAGATPAEKAPVKVESKPSGETKPKKSAKKR
jgi:putative FmdB family regulatory protein